MSFLFPSFLWGLLAVALPIAIHFFNFRKTKRVYFSNVSFLKAVDTQTKSIRKIKHWIALLTRILAIIALVLAFAQPYFPQEKKSPTTANSISNIYIDNSMSMQGELNTKRYLDVASGNIEDLMSKHPNANALQLTTNDFDSGEQSLANANQIRDRLTTLELSTSARTFEEVFNRQKNSIGRHHAGPGNQVYWFSDFQKSTAGNLAELKVDSTASIHIVPIQAKNQKNVYIDSVWLSTPFIREGQNNSLQVKVNNSGSESVENLVLKLALDNTQASTTAVSIAPNSSTTASFNFNVASKGDKMGTISFDDYPIIFDNTFYFVLTASPRIRILHMMGESANVKAIGQVYANDSLFDFHSQSISSVDPGIIATHDLVILNGVDQISTSVKAELQQLVKTGGGLAIVPSAAPNLPLYKDMLQPLGLRSLAMSSSKEPIPLKAPDRNIPFFKDVFEASRQSDPNVDMPAAQSVWNWGQTGHGLLTFRNGEAFLSQSGSGNGHYYLFASPLMSTYNGLAEHALFVPIMYKLAAMSVRSSPLSYTFDQSPVVLDIDRPDSPKEVLYTLKTKDSELIPAQRMVGNKLYLELPHTHDIKTLEPGYYQLHDESGQLTTLAFNYTKAESELQYYTTDELRDIFSTQKNVTVYDGIDDTAYKSAFASNHEPSALWKYFLFACLGFLLLEVLFLRFLKE
ncbi:putative membrane protein (TIGR02226 family) [Dyadobacter jejuensis]|uniref:Putative membrane protein (TIGR02226 family) n=1 Tax=Dyadobacter jejuensis TaxID=1082580 RepID=A0A316ALX1_9BACT|nr:BatA domain-containing protein [Dyadobacter jejuensis]PWJ58418.1 putative membrane protein (TIGR02226 family) [Dyadobacter jejuensis]